jgi:hypothetical protein
MAEVLNECTAQSKGEQRLAHLLQSFQDSELRLAFTIDFIPGCREIDLLIAHDKLGIFVVEVQGGTAFRPSEHLAECVGDRRSHQ